MHIDPITKVVVGFILRRNDGDLFAQLFYVEDWK